jgi:hypothetical protein
MSRGDDSCCQHSSMIFFMLHPLNPMIFRAVWKWEFEGIYISYLQVYLDILVHLAEILVSYISCLNLWSFVIAFWTNLAFSKAHLTVNQALLLSFLKFKNAIASCISLKEFILTWARCLLSMETDLTFPNFSKTLHRSYGSSSKSTAESRDWISISAVGSIIVWWVSSLSELLLHTDLGGDESMLFHDESP